MHAKWKRSARIFLLVFACFAISSMRAQTPEPAPADDDENEKITPTLSLALDLRENGPTRVSFYTLGQTDKAPEIKSVLERSLGCSLKEASRFHPTGTNYSGTCTLPFSGSGLSHAGRIATDPLRAYALAHKLEEIHLELLLPDTEIRDTWPPVKSAAYFPVPTSRRARRAFEAMRAYSWRVDTSLPEFVQFRIGYDSAAIGRRAGMVLAVLFLPLFFVAWMSRRALSAQNTDKSSVWFSYTRYLQWTLNVSLVAWWAALETAQFRALANFLIAGSPLRYSPVSSVLYTLIEWIPPAVIWAICVLQSHPVQQKLRGLAWTRKELVIQTIYALAASLLPIMLAVQGISAIAGGSLRAVILWFIAAFVIRLVARGQLVKLMGMQPQAVTTGELRDAAFGMAQRLGVKLQQVYLIPSGKGQMANAFARKGNTIAFTDYLLSRMSRREVRYILAHELSHLKLKHPQKLSTVFAVTAGSAIFFMISVSGSQLSSPFARYGLMFAMITLVPFFWSRRFEYAADASAVATTRDPEGAISALFKLSSLNMHPLQWSKWSEKWLTHPSMHRRIEAIAKRASLRAERVSEIARTGLKEQATYSIPSPATSAKRVLSSTKKMSNLRSITFAVLGSIIFTPVAFSLIAQLPRWSKFEREAIYLAGIAGTIVAYLVCSNSISTRRLKSEVPALKANLLTEGIEAGSWNGIPVGLAPGAVPRSYEGDTHWDLGFLFIRSDRICYRGEETKFALLRDQITDIRLGPGSPTWAHSQRIYIAWKDAASSTGGVFSLACAHPETTLALKKRTRLLFEQLLQWKKTSSSSRPMPPQLQALRAPQFGEVTGKSPLTLRKPRFIVKELLWTGVLAALVAVLSGLPFHLVGYLLIPREIGLPRLNGPGSGWYVLAVAVCLRFLQFMPVLLYKEQPVLQAQPLSPRSNAASGDVFPAAKPVEEPVPR
jgi:Zn-dependent protease with chaperone function